MIKKATIAIALLALLVALFPCAFAQTIVTGEIAGTLTDQTSAVVPNGSLTLTSLATGETKTATSGRAGEFRFSLLRPGAYSLKASAKGFSEVEKHVTAQLGQVQDLKIQLGVQSQTQVVEVSETASLLQSENANLATTYNQAELAQLPAPGNDMTAYAQTAPGVTVSTGGGYGNFSAFGLPGVSNLFTINGADNMDPYLNLNNSGASNLTLGANEISEAAVVLNGYTGQYGRQAGAQVNYVTKSGANAFHGNAYWNYNEKVLNANDWFNNANSTDRPFAISNAWADSLGGPIKKNKAFFFVDNEGMRYVLPGGGGLTAIPTSAFSSYVLNNIKTTNPSALPVYTNALNLYAGASGAGRATTISPALDPTYGCGNFAGIGGWGTAAKPCAETFQSTVNNLNTEWLMAVKVDYNINADHHIFFRFNTDHGVQATGTDPINSAFNANSVQPSYGGQIGYTASFGPRMVNQLVASASYYAAIFGPPNFSNATSTFPSTFAFTDGDFANLGGNDYEYPAGRKVRQNQIIDDFAIIAGEQTVKFGVNARKNFVSTYGALPETSGLYTFNDMRDFVNGTLANGSTYTQNFVNVGAEPLSMYSVGFYGQDEWKVRKNLMVTIAFRFDKNSNISCGNGCFNEMSEPFSVVSHNVTTPYNSTIQTGLTKAFPNLEPIVSEPRLGVAWNVAKNTVIRGGVGIFTDLYQGLVADRFITNSPGVMSFTTYSGSVAPGAAGSAQSLVTASNTAFQNGFAKGATLAQLQSAVAGFSVPNFNTVASNYSNPKYLEWNFEVQQGLGNNMSLSVNYVGNHGTDETLQNLYLNAYAKNFSGLPTTVPDARFGEIRELYSGGYSNFDGLVSTLKWHIGSQFQGSFSYTYSHSLDTCSNDCLEPFNFLTAASLRYQNSPNIGLSYGSSDYDVRHSINAHYVYTVAPSMFNNRAVKAVAGNWTLAGTVLYHSGYPFSVVDTGVRGAQGVGNLAGIATDVVLADWISPTTTYPSCTTPNSTCYSKSLFATAASQTNFGNIPRNAFRGPGYFDTDINVNRTFSINERYKFLIGMYFFNLFNHPNFDLPVNNLNSGEFGSIISTVSAPSSPYGSFQGSAVSGRVGELQLKFSF